MSDYVAPKRHIGFFGADMLSAKLISDTVNPKKQGHLHNSQIDCGAACFNFFFFCLVD